MLLGLWNTQGWLPYYLHSDGAEKLTGKSMKVASFNVLSSNKKYDQVLDELLKESPDIILLLELNQKWVLELQPLKVHYPHSLIEPQEGNFGIGLFSKMPFRLSKIERFGEVPSLYAQVELGSEMVHLIGTHPLPPIGSQWSAKRNRQMQAIAKFVKGKEGQCIVMGDLNMTPYSYVFQDFVKTTHLRDTSVGFGIQPTWQASMPFFAIPIDHILVSEGFHVKQRKVHGTFGSDHSFISATLFLSEYDS
jgi:endonuclease/exonuclease/phosphatase (EEP) superfamily protein YafD